MFASWSSSLVAFRRASFCCTNFSSNSVRSIVTLSSSFLHHISHRNSFCRNRNGVVILLHWDIFGQRRWRALWTCIDLGTHKT
ncbi:hypothetical protein EMPS_00254 [Entomortierella parvispora]|uniref:Uncharacterized protein n=1 Tax=Entomortierella parvispora TaxID=205924 RepID=A0A9P3H064_9FUNG|nr:hypothetical protein EMPS_00254 [Entomortierella parvispora]